MQVCYYSSNRCGYALLFCALLLTGCGPTDYQQPIQNFSAASAVVAASASSYLNSINVTEQERALRESAFEGKPIDLSEIDKLALITPEELALRSKAITALSNYTTSLAILASGKAGSNTAADFKDLEGTLQKVATDAGSIKGKTLDNAKFSGIASAAAAAVGAVAQLVIDHKARKIIEASVVRDEKPIEDLIELIGNEMQLAYQLQKAAVSATRVYLTSAYKEAITPTSPAGALPTTISTRLSVADTLTTYRKQQALIEAADPEPVILQMKAAYAALVQYAHDDHDPKSTAELWKNVQDFIAAAQPLGQAIHDLVSATS